MPIVTSPERIAEIFDDPQVRRLASLAKLRFADGVRDAALGYAVAVSRPNDNRPRALHREQSAPANPPAAIIASMFRGSTTRPSPKP
jgi:hypothetical protein